MAAPSRALIFGERSQIDEIAQRILDFVPGARDLPPEARMALAQISVAHGLDPFTGEVWGIPQKERETGRVIGFRLMVGIQGWRRKAHDTNEYCGRAFYDCTPEERAALGCGRGDLAVKCVVSRRKTGQHPMLFDGFGVFKSGEKSKMNPLTCVRYRAERDAMKAAFPLGLGGGGPMSVSIVGEDGEIIDDPITPPTAPQAPLTYGAPSGAPAKTEAPPPVATATTPSSATSSAPQPTTDKPAKPCDIKCALAVWNRLCAEIADTNPHYRNGGGKPNYNKIQWSLAGLGYGTVDNNNVETAFDELSRHASEKHADKDKPATPASPRVLEMEPLDESEIPF